MFEQQIWNYLRNQGLNEYAVAGIMGNMYAESGLAPNNLQNTFNRKLNMTDREYTDAVDNGTYKNFIKDKAGYGLCQWSSEGRKAKLYTFLKNQGKSINDLTGQLDFFLQEIREYSDVMEVLCGATTIKEASDIILIRYERPKNQSAAVLEKRAARGRKYYDKYSKGDLLNMNFDRYINSETTHYIANSGGDERGGITGGTTGDQTGHEWELRKWYNRPWTHVFRYEPDKRVGETLCDLACRAAANDLIGYDQLQRYTYWQQLEKANYNPSDINVACEEDCSAGVAANVKAAGYLLGITALQQVSERMNSRNTVDQLKKAGFTVLTDNKYLSNGKYLQPGDILLYENHHVATNITKGKKAEDIIKPVIAPDSDTIGVATAKGSMHVRKEADGNSASLGVIQKGQKVEVLEKLDTGWYKIVWAKGADGYAYTSNRGGKYYDYVEAKEASNIVRAKKKPSKFDESVAGEYTVICSSLNVRQGAGPQQPIMTTVTRGMELLCDGSYEEFNKIKWYYVTFVRKGVTYYGFCSSKPSFIRRK